MPVPTLLQLSYLPVVSQVPLVKQLGCKAGQNSGTTRQRLLYPLQSLYPKQMTSVKSSRRQLIQKNGYIDTGQCQNRAFEQFIQAGILWRTRLFAGRTSLQKVPARQKSLIRNMQFLR